MLGENTPDPLGTTPRGPTSPLPASTLPEDIRDPSTLPAPTDGPADARAGGSQTQAQTNSPLFVEWGSVVPEVPGYTSWAKLAQGGMGVVYTAWDMKFGREVAVKTLLPALTGRPEFAAQFEREAKITARLPHPGVPPVHTLGTLVDGRPFLAMKLIKGQTLAEEIASRSTPATLRLLQVFEQVCQTVGFAHSQGIIHRDLKPANVMVGAFGEVQVMDWGLAKVIRGDTGLVEPGGGAGAFEDSRGATLGGSGTRAGTVKGTPAYMAPEQARGEWDKVDVRADVFALGGILCAVLTGEAPFAGGGTRDVLKKAAAGDLGEALARLDGSGAEPDLIALCKRCLRPEQDQRPADGTAVADAVAAYRAGREERVRKAEVDRVAAESRADEAFRRAEAEERARIAAEARAEAEAAKAREQRTRRLTQVGLVTAVGLLLLGGVGFAWWDDRRAEQARIKQVEFEAEQARQQAASRVEQAARVARAKAGTDQVLVQLPELYRRALWGQAEGLLKQTTLSAGPEADELLRERLTRASRELAILVRLDQIRTDKATRSRGGWDPALVKDYEVFFRELGYDFVQTDPAGRAILVERLRSDPLREYLLVALDDWLPAEGDERTAANIAEVTVGATGETWRGKLRGGRDTALLVFNGQVVVPWDEMSAPSVASLGLLLIKIAPGSKDWALAKMEDALKRHPSDFWLHLYIGQERLKRGEVEAAIGAFRAAAAVRPEAQAARQLLAEALARRK